MMSTRTRTKSAGIEFPHAENRNTRSKVSWPSPNQSSGMSSNKYYAGAKFDTIPSLSDLPAPPRHWTDSATRSQSTPSSPVTISTKPSAGISLDIGSLFGPGAPLSCDKSRQQKVPGVTKSASLPQSGMMNMAKKKQVPLKADPQVVFKTPKTVKARATVKVPIKPKKMETPEKISPTPVTPKSTPAASDEGIKRNDAGSKVNGNGKTEAAVTTGVSGLDLMEMLIRASPTTHRQDLNSTPAPVKASPVNLSPCHLQLGSMDSQYKDISNHLKSILKVSA